MTNQPSHSEVREIDQVSHQITTMVNRLRQDIKLSTFYQVKFDYKRAYRNVSLNHFSLIELLIIISIILVIISLLSPAINNLMKNSKKFACRNNMHSIGISYLTYSEDYDNSVARWRNNNDPLNKTGIGGVYKDWMNRSWKTNGFKLLDEYLNPYSDSWFCPDDPEGDSLVWPGKQKDQSTRAYYSTIGLSYIRNNDFIRKGKYRVNDLIRPEISIAWSEYPGWDVARNLSRPIWWTDLPKWSFHDNLEPFSVNQTVTNMLFYDGHVSEEQITTGKLNDNKNYTWNGF